MSDPTDKRQALETAIASSASLVTDDGSTPKPIASLTRRIAHVAVILARMNHQGRADLVDMQSVHAWGGVLQIEPQQDTIRRLLESRLTDAAALRIDLHGRRRGGCSGCTNRR